jgi:long-chain fatty acid transport protein
MNTSRAVLVAALTLAGGARAAGISLDAHGGRATGLATAVTAQIDDPSAVFYNPAGLLHTEGLQVLAGDTLIVPRVRFDSKTSGLSTTNEFSISPPPYAFASFKPSKDLALGFGVFTHYGASASWPDEWEHRFRSLRSQLATYYFNPEVAYRVLPRVRLGVGFQAVRGTLRIERRLNFVDTEGTVVLSGAGWGYGFNAGVQVDILPEKLAFGLSYRSVATVDFRGGATFENIPRELSGTLKDQPIESTIRTPDTVFAGVSYRVTPELLLAADVNWYRWSNVPDITFVFEDAALTQKVPKRWRNSFNYHLGAEYRLLPELALRLGAVYDPTPSPVDTLTPDLPDSNRLKGTLGAGYTRGRLNLDLGYQFVLVDGLESTAPGYEGRYSGSAHVLGLSIGYRL